MKNILLLSASLLLAQIGAAQNAAEVVSITAPSAVAPGATFTATIVMTNSGGNAWTSSGLYRLGSESPRNNLTWKADGRVELPSDPINPGATATFTATFTAPTTPGVYNFSWGMVQDLVEWFGPIASRQIKVGNGQFTPGDLVVLQTVATASDPITANGTAIVLKNISKSSGATTFEVALPVTGSNAMLSGASPFSGTIDLSSDKRYVVVGGYNQTNLPSGFNLESSGITPRIIGTVSSSGQYEVGPSAAASDVSGPVARALRGSISDGQGNFWGGGVNNAGIYYYGTKSAPVLISNLDPNAIGGTGVGAIRDLIMVNGKPGFSSSQYPSSGNHGISIFNNVSPTMPQEPSFVLDAGNAVTGNTGTPSLKGFSFNTNLTIAYVVDLRASPNGGIYRYNGTGTGLPGSWTYAYAISVAGEFPTGAFHEVIADFPGTSPKVYATVASGSGNASTATHLVTFVDTGETSPTFTSLATAPITAPFRGLTFAPKASVVTAVVISITKSGSNVVVSWTGTGTLQSAGVASGPYVPVAGSPTSPYTTAVSGTSQFFRVLTP